MLKVYLTCIIFICFAAACSKDNHVLPANELSGNWKYIGNQQLSTNGRFAEKDSSDYFLNFTNDSFLLQKKGIRICGKYIYSKTENLANLVLRSDTVAYHFRISFLNDTLTLTSEDGTKPNVDYFIHSLKQLKNCQ